MNETKIVQSLLTWFARNARDLPWRRTRDPYAIWVSEIMLQQTQVKTVMPYWERWMQKLPDIPALARASSEELHKLWEGLGYYTRVRNLQKAAQVVVNSHGGKFPQDYAQIIELPGIGPYTAGAICSIAFNQPKPILDGNAVRVLSRVFGIAGDARKARTRAKLWRIAGELVACAARQAPREKRPASAFNQAIMELGARVCTPRQTKCASCPIAKQCVAYQEDRVQELPRLGARARAMPRHFVAFVVQRRGRFLVRQRPAGVVNAHLWEFPNVEIGPDNDIKNRAASNVGRSPWGVRAAPKSLKAELQTDWRRTTLKRAARSALGLTPKALQPLCTIRHSITRYRITLQAFRVQDELPDSRSVATGVWLTRKELNRLTFANAHRRILQSSILRRAGRV